MIDSGWAWYVAGLLTLPLAGICFAVFAWAFSRNHGEECGICGKVIGRLGVDRRIVTEFRSWAHIFRGCTLKLTRVELARIILGCVAGGGFGIIVAALTR